MMTKKFKLTSKSQVTIPEVVKKALRLGAGGAVCFHIQDGRVEVVPSKNEKMSIFDLGKKYKTKPCKKVSVEDMNDVIQRKRMDEAKDNR